MIQLSQKAQWTLVVVLGFVVVLLSVSLFASAVQAQDPGPVSASASASQSQSQAGASAGAVAGSASYGVAVGGGGGGGGSASANNAGNVQAIQFNSEAEDLGDMVGTAIAPALTTTLSDTCMGSTSGGLGVSGGGISFGSTWSDEECVRRLHARQLTAWGANNLAMEIMCASPHVVEADARLMKMGETPSCTANALAAKPKDGEESANYIKIYPLNPELTAYYGGGEDVMTVDEFAAAAKR